MWITIEVKDDRQAARLIMDLIDHPEDPVLSPTQEHPIEVSLVEDTYSIIAMVDRYRRVKDGDYTSDELVDIILGRRLA